MEEKASNIKPKQYSHIDYEALLIYAMKHHISLERAIEENGLVIARSTVIRNIRKMKQDVSRDNSIIEFYQEEYVPSCQRPELPARIIRGIASLPQKKVVIKNELEDLYNKLSIMNAIVQACDGNLAEATRKINSGQTILGNVKPISIQGLGKNIKYFQEIKEIMEKEMKEEEKGEEK
jgi:hypothetical protein